MPDPPCTDTPTPEHRSKLPENLREARVAPRARRPPTPAQQAAWRANLARARAVLAARGWPHSERQRAAARRSIAKAQAAIRERGLPSAPARLIAARANLDKANAVLRAQGYPRNEAQREAARASLRQAWGVNADPKNYARCHAKKLKHGLYVRSLEATVPLLGESPEEFRTHLERIERALRPQNDLERKIVGRLADAIWRRLRFFRAQALWEAEALERVLDSVRQPTKLTPDQTRQRAYAIIECLTQHEHLFDVEYRLLYRVQRLLRALLRQRTGGDPKFKVISRRAQKDLRELEQIAAELELQRRLGDPDAEALRGIQQIAPDWELK